MLKPPEPKLRERLSRSPRPRRTREARPRWWDALGRMGRLGLPWK